MNKPIAIIAGEPNSISSEIIFKSWKLRKNYTHKPFLIIGSAKLLNMQKEKLKYPIKLKKINSNFKKTDLKGKELPIYDVKYIQKKSFEKITNKSNNYIFNCFDKAIKLTQSKKIVGFLNCPVSKETLFRKKHQGITEFLSKKNGTQGNEAMLIYNKELAVCPITTHIPLDQINRKISKSAIIKKVKIIDEFYKKFLKKKASIGILGLNPHNFMPSKRFEKTKIIIQAIQALKKQKVKIFGPVSPDTSFMSFNKSKFNVIVGMYHDQVLTPFKALYNFNAINITLGLPYIRISPDHGVAINIVGKGKANPNSLIESIKFFNYIK